ncbi:hypothetical protein GW881_00120 [Candidatus Roizmanbacteria bacterium]|nr:hypothetical protein [Candidatus Roizmanbacteria bacterium]
MTEKYSNICGILSGSFVFNNCVPSAPQAKGKLQYLKQREWSPKTIRFSL